LLDLQARNYIIACYAMSLTEGETLLSRKIRHATLAGYVRAAISCHTDQMLPNPRLADNDYIKIVLDAVRKYEDVPNRREMIHDAMFMYMLWRKHSPDCKLVALCEWFILGRYTGFRSAEWCHKHRTKWERIQDELWGDRPDCLGLIFEDFTFHTENGTTVVLSKTDWADPHRPLPAQIRYMKMRIRKQKNNDNYQVLTYKVAMKCTALCPVTAAFRIITRGYRLGLHKHHPAAVYFDTKSGEHRLITSNDANSYLRSVASAVYGIKKDGDELNKWSTHSIRVTACNLLHRARFSDSYIKNRLRWRSDSFLMYLRNTFYTADEHGKALDLEITPATTDRRPHEEHELLLAAAAAA
jgi:hypothetical protein